MRVAKIIFLVFCLKNDGPFASIKDSDQTAQIRRMI